MDKNEIRVEKLRNLVNEAGGNAAFARKYSKKDSEKQIDASYVSQVLNGHRSFGETAAQNMEEISTLPAGCFDCNDVTAYEFEEKAIPLLTWEQAVDWRNIIDSFNQNGGSMELYPAVKGCGKNTFALKVENEAMYNPGMSPSFKSGDIIYIDPDAKFTNKALAILKTKKGVDAIFRQIITENKTRYLKALNKDWPDRIIKMTDGYEILGLVINKYEDTSKYNE